MTDMQELSNTRRLVIKRKAHRATMSIQMAAKYIGCDVNAVRILIDLGYIKTLKIGAIKVPNFELERFMREATEEGIDYNAIITKYRKEHERKEQEA